MVIIEFLFNVDMENKTVVPAPTPLPASQALASGFSWDMINKIATTFEPIPWKLVVLLCSGPPSFAALCQLITPINVGQQLKPFHDKSDAKWVIETVQLQEWNLVQWKKVITRVVHPDKVTKHPSDSRERRHEITVAWNAYLDTIKPPPPIYEEPPNYNVYSDEEDEIIEITDTDDDSDGDDAWSLGERTMGFFTVRYGLMVFSMLHWNCIGVYVQDPFKVRHDNGNGPLKIDIILSHWTRDLSEFKNWDANNMFDVKLASPPTVAYIKRSVNCPNRTLDWMLRPPLPIVKDSCWVISTCILLSCIRNFWVLCKDIADRLKTIEPMTNWADTSAALLFQLLSLIAKQGTSIASRDSEFPKEASIIMTTLISEIRKTCPDQGAPETVNDNRFLFGLLLNSKEIKLLNVNSIIGVAASFWECTVVTGTHLSESPQYTYVLNVNNDTGEISSLASLDIGDVQFRQCATCKSHEVVARTVWTGSPPTELLVNVYENIATTLDFNPGIINFFYRETVESKVIEVAQYAIVAILIGLETHQLVAMVAPGYAYTPLKWILIDPSSTLWPPQQVITKFLPVGVLTAIVLRNIDIPDVDGFPTPDVDKEDVGQFAHTLIIVAPLTSILYEEWDCTTAEAENSQYAFMSTSVCLGDHGGCDCAKVGPRSDGGIIPGRSTSVLFHVIQEKGVSVISGRTYARLLEEKISHMNITKVGECNEEGVRQITVDCCSVGDNDEKIRLPKCGVHYMLKCAKLSLRSITESPPEHHYRIDSLMMIPIYQPSNPLAEYVRINRAYRALSIPRGFFKMEAASTADNRDVASHIFNTADSDIQSIVNPMMD